MNNLTIIQIISIGIITICNLSYLYHYIMLDGLITNNLIEEKKSSQISNILLVLNISLIIFSVYVYIVNDVQPLDYLGPISMSIVLLTIYFVGIFTMWDYSFVLKNLLEYFMESEYSKDTSTSLIEFKIDVIELVKSNPDYLASFEVNSFLFDTDVDDEEEAEEAEEYSENEENYDYVSNAFNHLNSFISEGKEDYYIFPLYKELLILTKRIFKDKLSSMINSPILNSYLIDNISLLSTIMTILKDEKLVKALNSDLGSTELEDLTARFKALNKNMDTGVKYIKDEKERFEKASETTEIIDSLNEVRSMKEMLDSLK